MTTATYTIRRPGHTCWASELRTPAEALREWRDAERVIPGHIILREDEGGPAEVSWIELRFGEGL